MHRLIDLSLRNKFLVLILTAVMVGFGINSMLRLPIDAVPDVTPNQVLVLTQAPGLSPVEVERFITFPVETAMSGLPGITDIRSISRFGLSSVYIYFEEGMDLYFVRRLVMERLPEAREAIPEGMGTPSMGPISTGLGEIYQFEVHGKGKSLMDLRSVLEWDIAFRLRSVPGVVEVNSYGGEMKTYEVQIDPDKLVSYNVPLDTVFEALERNNANAGGAYIERAQEQYVIRGEGLVERLSDIDNIVVSAGEGGTPVYIRNLGQTVFAPQVRQGAVTRDGNGETVTGVVMMLMGENSRVVADRVKEALEEIKRSLPEGVTIETYYDRTELVQKTIGTVRTNLIEGGVLVVAVLLLLLGNVKGGLIVAAAIPLSMLFAFTGMVQAGLSGNLMSLGAIDFGLIVDGSVVMIENIVRRLGEARGSASREEVVREAGKEVARPIFFAVLIIIIVYLPILTLEGVEGKMFRPMALTVVFALIGSLILALTLMPVLAALAFRKHTEEREPRLVHWLKERYRPILGWTLGHPGLTGGVAAGVFVLSLGSRAVHGIRVHPAARRGRDRRSGVAPAERRPDGIRQEHDDDREDAEEVSRGGDRRVTHRRRRDSDRSDGRRNQRHLRDPEGSRRVDHRQRPRGADREVQRGARGRGARQCLQLLTAHRAAGAGADRRRPLGCGDHAVRRRPRRTATGRRTRSSASSAASPARRT